MLPGYNRSLFHHGRGGVVGLGLGIGVPLGVGLGRRVGVAAGVALGEDRKRDRGASGRSDRELRRERD